MLVDEAFRDEALVSSNERSAELTLIDIEKIDNRVVCTRCHPWIPLCKVNIIHWEEVIFELVSKLKRWRAIILGRSQLVKLDRTDDVSSCHDW